MLFQINNLGGDFLNPILQNISSILFMNLSSALLRSLLEIIVLIFTKDQLKSYWDFGVLSKQREVSDTLIVAIKSPQLVAWTVSILVQQQFIFSRRFCLRCRSFPAWVCTTGRCVPENSSFQTSSSWTSSEAAPKFITKPFSSLSGKVIDINFCFKIK